MKSCKEISGLTEGWCVECRPGERDATLRHYLKADVAWRYGSVERLVAEASRRGIVLTVGDVRVRDKAAGKEDAA